MLEPFVKALQLPLRFDAARLRGDLDLVEGKDWIPHFNRAYYEGDWSGVPLRQPLGATHPVQALYPNPGISEWTDTAVLRRCPYFTEVLGEFQCPLRSARLLRLGVGSRIKEHTDYDLGIEDGEVRIHVPVSSNPEVEFLLDGERMFLLEGEAWFLNFNLPHQVENRGATSRVHLVVDCVVDAWLESLLERAAGST